MWMGRLGVVILALVLVCIVLLALRLTFLTLRRHSRKRRFAQKSNGKLKGNR